MEEDDNQDWSPKNYKPQQVHKDWKNGRMGPHWKQEILAYNLWTFDTVQ